VTSTASSDAAFVLTITPELSVASEWDDDNVVDEAYAGAGRVCGVTNLGCIPSG
jgi:hypothetical protein